MVGSWEFNSHWRKLNFLLKLFKTPWCQFCTEMSDLCYLWKPRVCERLSVMQELTWVRFCAQSTKFILFLVNQEYPPLRLALLIEDLKSLGLKLPRIPLKMKIGQDFGFELAKITPPHQKWKLVRTLDLNFTRIPPKWKLVRTLDFNFPRIPL